jgi:hypothetical protein
VLCGALPAVLLVALLAPPALSASVRPADWYEHLWYVWHQSGSIRTNGVPSFFVHNLDAVYNPHYAFYGGTLYVSAAVLGLVLGSATAAFNTFWVAALLMAYGGWYSLARMAGLGQWTAHVPGVLFITSPYYLTLIYRAGAWPELIAVSTIPLLLASGLSVLRSDRLRPWPALALATTSVLFTGSHTITLVWGSLVLVVIAVTFSILLPETRRLLTRRGGLRVLGIMFPALLVNAWFLMPAAAYQSMTYIASLPAKTNLQWADQFVAPRYLFSLERIASPPRLMVMELPMLTIGWIVIGLAIATAARRTPWFRLVLTLLGATTVLLMLMTNVSLILALPDPLPHIQFGYRLESYILLAVSAMSIGMLRLAHHPSRLQTIWRWVALPLLALMIIQASAQTHAHQRETGNVSSARPYHSKGAHPSELDYVSSQLPLLDTKNLHGADFPVRAERGDHTTVTVGVAPGQTISTNIALMPPLVKITGARVVGRDAVGWAILKVADDATPNAARITIRPAQPWPVLLGRALTAIGLGGLLANAIAMAITHRRRQKHAAII